MFRPSSNARSSRCTPLRCAIPLSIIFSPSFPSGERRAQKYDNQFHRPRTHRRGYRVSSLSCLVCKRALALASSPVRGRAHLFSSSYSAGRTSSLELPVGYSTLEYSSHVSFWFRPAFLSSASWRLPPRSLIGLPFSSPFAAVGRTGYAFIIGLSRSSSLRVFVTAVSCELRCACPNGFSGLQTSGSLDQ